MAWGVLEVRGSGRTRRWRRCRRSTAGWRRKTLFATCSNCHISKERFMLFKSWIDKSLSPLGAIGGHRPRSRKAKASQPRRQRLWLEVLEDRRVLSAVIVTNNTDVTDGDTSSIDALIRDPGPVTAGTAGTISLREAILASNNTPGAEQHHVRSRHLRPAHPAHPGGAIDHEWRDHHGPGGGQHHGERRIPLVYLQHCDDVRRPPRRHPGRAEAHRRQGVICRSDSVAVRLS